ncbi:hypothetical protein VZO05_10675 [Aggregatilineales bacterium SYSU G02658]
MEWLVAVIGALLGGAFMWHRQRTTGQRGSVPLPSHYIPVIYGGGFRWGRGQRESLDTLCLIDSGLAIVGMETVLELSFSELRGLFRHEAAHSIQFDLYLEREGRWGHLSVFLRLPDAPTLVKLLRRARPDLVIGDSGEVAVYNAQLADQTLQGELSLGAEVTIYLVGRLVVVTQADVILAKLAVAGIRRVIATEQSNGRGLVRLYSATETTLFFSDQYLALAQHLADQARAPLDIVTLSERKNK